MKEAKDKIRRRLPILVKNRKGKLMFPYKNLGVMDLLVDIIYKLLEEHKQQEMSSETLKKFVEGFYVWHEKTQAGSIRYSDWDKYVEQYFSTPPLEQKKECDCTAQSSWHNSIHRGEECDSCGGIIKFKKELKDKEKRCACFNPRCGQWLKNICKVDDADCEERINITQER